MVIVSMELALPFDEIISGEEMYRRDQWAEYEGLFPRNNKKINEVEGQVKDLRVDINTSFLVSLGDW
jgi:hypothetical protein